ncbi:MAG: hypothetical protein ACRCX8_15785 [Sarcina sp.]
MEENKELTRGEVFDVLTFANNLWGTNQVFTPMLLHQNLQNLNNNQLLPTPEAVQKALVNVKGSSKELVGYSQTLENTDMIYKKLMNYYSHMLSFDLSITCTNVKNSSEYRSKEYKEDLERVYSFFDKFDYRNEFSKVTKQILRNETYFTWFRSDSVNAYTLQVLPQERCLTTQYFNKGALFFDFDMTYFLQAGVDIDAYAPIFKEYYIEAFEGENVGKYNPMNPLKDRDGTFAMYHQTSPTEGAWAFKFDSSNFLSVPYLSTMIPDVLNNQLIRDLQKDKDFQTAYALLFGEMKMLDNQKSGEKKDAFAVSPTFLGQMLQLINSSLSKYTKVNAVPAENLKMHQYEDKNPNMYIDKLKTSSGIGNSASRLIYSDDKMSQEEIQDAILTDGNLMKQVYAQFEYFLEFFVNKKTRKYKFAFTFDGINYNFDRDDRIDRLIQYADRGIVLNESSWASALGMKPQEFSRSLEEAKNGNFNEKLSLLLSIHTQGSSDGEKGSRPRKKRVSTESRDYD